MKNVFYFSNYIVSLAFCILDTISMAYCFRAGTFWGTMAALIILRQLIASVNELLTVSKRMLNDVKEENHKANHNVNQKSTKNNVIRMGFDMSAK